jgi:hypothetical protein
VRGAGRGNGPAERLTPRPGPTPPRGQARRRGPRRRASQGLERAAPRRRRRGGQEVQGCPLGTAEEPHQPHRQPSRHATQAQTPRRRRLARLHPQRSVPSHLRRRPRPRQRRRADRPVDLPRQPLPAAGVRQGRQNHPQTPRRHPRRDPTRHQQRPRRRPQQRRAPHHQPRPRLPHRRSSPRPRHAHLRTDHPPTTSRATQHSPRLTHTHAGRTGKICLYLFLQFGDLGVENGEDRHPRLN